jgi:quercetin 2,3-dioxygenase
MDSNGFCVCCEYENSKVYNALLSAGEPVSYELKKGRHAWVRVVKGEIGINGTSLKAGDGVAVSDESSLALSATSDAEIVFFDLA